MKFRFCSILFLLVLLIGCAPAKKVKSWTSIPPVQKGENRYVNAWLEPQKRDKKFFVSFRLSIKNKTDKELKIDWNKTRYLHKGKPYGVFAFKGIDPATIKDQSIPSDSIAPGDTFSKEIFPANLIAFTPMREEVLDKKGKGLYPGPIPAGKNGIYLVVWQGGEEVHTELTVNIAGNP